MNKIRKNTFIKNQTGYSLLELILVIVLIAIIAGVTARMFTWGLDIFDFVSERKDVLQSSRIGMEMLVKDLRSIKSTDDIVAASHSQLDFYNINDERITYDYNSGVISRNENILVEGLSSFQFRYYDVNNSDLSSPVSSTSAIWKIKFTISASINGDPFQLESSVIPRNFE